MSEQVRVDESTWKMLNSMKEPGDSFDDVINRLVDELDHYKFACGEE